MLKQQRKRAGGIMKHNTNAFKNLPATTRASRPATTSTRAVAPAKKAKQPAKPASRSAGPGPGWCWSHGGRWGVRVAGRLPCPRGSSSRCRHPRAASPAAVAAPAETGCK
eukprot:jgi/Tetstr1/425448/TSEL_015895.t1